MSIQSAEVKQRIAGWQSELREMTKDETVKLYAAKTEDVSLSIEQIGEIVLHVTGVSYKQVIAPSRSRNIVQSRHLIAYFARNVCGTSWRLIGEYIGGRDHTTAMHGHKSISDLLECGDQATITSVTQINVYLEEVRKRIANEEN